MTRRLSIWIAVLLAGALLGCRPTVLVLGLDGAEWDVMEPLMEAGLLPTFERIVRGGARAELDCVPAWPQFPCFCPPVWTSIATGHDVHRHRMRRVEQPVSERGVKALWNVLADHGGTSSTLAYRNAWPPEEDVDFVLTEPGADWAARQVMAVWPLYQGGALLDPAGRARPIDLLERLGFRPGVGTLPPAWNMLARDRVTMGALDGLAALQQTDLTMVILHSPDKAEHAGWAQVQAVPGAPIREDVLVIQGLIYRRTGPAFSTAFAGGSTVVSQYMEIDAWLSGFLERFDYQYVVLVSDHGMTRNTGPGVAGHHGPNETDAHQGIFAIHGRGVRPDTHLGTVSVLDVAPTVAYVLGLPVGEDLPGRVLLEAFYRERTELFPVRSVPTWED